MKTTFTPISDGAIYRTCINTIESNAEKLVLETEKIEKGVSEWCKSTFLCKNDHLVIIRQRYNGKPSKSLPVGEPREYRVSKNNQGDFPSEAFSF